MASTLPPTPSFNVNVPVVTSEGGTEHAYKDPKSPESILRKTAELNVQAAVDSKFDVATSPYHDGFVNGPMGYIGTLNLLFDLNLTSKRYAIQTILTLIILLFIFMISMQKKMPVWLNMATLTVSVVLMLVVIMLTVNR